MRTTDEKKRLTATAQVATTIAAANSSSPTAWGAGGTESLQWKRPTSSPVTTNEPSHRGRAATTVT
jgi:hypothetical protein